LAEYKSNLLEIVAYIHSLPTASSQPPVVILVTNPPVSPLWGERAMERYGMPESDRSLETAGEYAGACVEAGQEAGVPVVNLWAAMQQKRPHDWPALLSDGLHLNPEGNALVAELLLETIEREYRNFRVDPCQHSGNYSNSGSRSALPVQVPFVSTPFSRHCQRHVNATSTPLQRHVRAHGTIGWTIVGPSSQGMYGASCSPRVAARHTSIVGKAISPPWWRKGGMV